MTRRLFRHKLCTDPLLFSISNCISSFRHVISRCKVRSEKSEVPEDSKNVFLHWGNVLAQPVSTLMQSIVIRETSDGQIIIAGAQDVAAESHQEAIRLLEIGSLSRATGKPLRRLLHQYY